MATCGVYKITNLITTECYIGSSKDIERRFEQHKKNSSSKKLKESILKYGLDNFRFEILEECNIVQFKKKEKLHIYEYNCILYGFNSKNRSNIDNIKVYQLKVDVNEEKEFIDKMNKRKEEQGFKSDSSYIRFLITKDFTKNE